MLEQIRNFLLHPLRTILNKVLNERQMEKFDRVMEKVNFVPNFIIRNTIGRLLKRIKDEEKLEIIKKELETSIIWNRIERILLLVGLLVVLILRLFGKEI